MYALIVGLGSIGCRHFNNLCELGVRKLAVFRSRNLPPPADLKTSEYETFSDYGQALDAGPDVVVIANPTAFHSVFAIKAVERGCGVYLEKPVSHELEGARKLMSLVQEKGVAVAVGCQFRFHPNLEDIKSWLDGGLLGRIKNVKAVSGEYLPNWHPWEDYRESYAARADLGGGVVLTQIHDMDYLFWLFGPMSDVRATGGHRSSLEIDVEDTADISMKTADGAEVSLSLDYLSDPPVKTLYIDGEQGSITWDYYAGRARLENDGELIRESVVSKDWERNDMFMSAMDEFLRAYREGTAPKIPLTEGVEVLKMALVAKESMLKGGQ